MKIKIRRARPEEAPLLTEIAHAAKRYWGYPEHWIVQWGDALTLSPAFVLRHFVFAAVEAGTVLGFYALAAGRPAAALEHLWVRPEYHRRGVGRALLQHARAVAAAHGARVLEIDADPHAEGFYRAVGAVRIGEVDATMDGVPRTLPRLQLGTGSLRAGHTSDLEL